MAILPYARPRKDDPPMTAPSRRSRPSRTWQVEPLEERALLTTVYGPEPASLSAAPAPAFPLPSVWWSSGFASSSIAERGRFVTRALGEPSSDLTMVFHPKEMRVGQASISAAMGTVAFETASNAFGATESYSIDQGPAKAIRYAGGMDGVPLPFPTLMIRGVAANAIPGRGPLNIGWSALGRFRDDMEGPPPRFGLRTLLFFVSPDSSYWENGMIGKSHESFAFAPGESASASPGHASPHLESNSNSSESTGYSSSTTSTTNLIALSTGTSNSNVMIWVDANTWTSDTSISSLLLSQGDFDLGSLFLDQDDVPEVTVRLAAILNEWLEDAVDLPFPLMGPMQQITKLDPLDESSLAVTATLLTVASASEHPASTAGPGQAPAKNSATAPVPLAVTPPPSWAGFVIGLDEAFEANRLATRQWPSSTESSGKAGSHDEAAEAARTVEHSAVDEAIEDLDREPPPQDAVDALFLPPPEKGDDGDDEPDDPSAKDRRLSAAARVSLSLALAPTLWADRLSRLGHRQRRRALSAPDARTENGNPLPRPQAP